ncbi:PAS domain-containing sensor histidine kinase [Cupriavidus oxalaticus]|uniref:PAS domain-containing sensor histidine kinase n=1 Tax=Cupriavidus oxalaticus TaxID=96344 RepID=UPI00317581CC
MTDDHHIRRESADDIVPWRTSADTLQAIIDNIPLQAWTCEANGEADFFNCYWLAYTGLSASAALGRGWTDAVHPDDRPALVMWWQRALYVCKPFEYELRMRRADGEYRWFVIRVHPLLDGNDNIVKWYATNTEIEHRHRATQELRASAEAYRIILDSVPGLLFTTTPTGEVEFVNRTLLLYFCRSLDELQGWKQSDAVHPDDIQSTAREWSKALETGEPCSFEQRLRKFDGTYRWFLFHAIPQRESDGSISRWFGTLTDLDDLRRMEAQLGAMNARLAHASQLAAISELSAAIAHEISHPLTSVVTNSDACRRWLSAEPPNVDRAIITLQRISRDAEAAAQIVSNLRSLFRRDRMELVDVDLNQAADEVLFLLARELSRLGIVTERSFDPILPIVRADHIQIQQVLVNLVRNALEAMAEVRSNPRVLRVSTCAMGAEVILQISDNGVGLPADANVFEAFYTTKPWGMGIGLSLSQSIIAMHSGRIWAEPRATGSGATFAIALRAPGATAG